MPAWLGELRAQLALGDDDAARAIAGKLEHGPEWARQYSTALLALQGTAETESDNAMTLLKQSHAAAPGEPAPMTALVEALLRRGDAGEARAVLTEWIKTHARDPAAQVLLGRSAEATRQFDEARTHYQRALVLLPSHTAAQTGMARTYLAQRRLDAAQKAAQAAIKLDALAFEPRLLAAEINRAQGNVEEAIRQAGEAAQLDARDARPHVLLGKIYLERKDYAAAVSAWEQAVALDASASNIATLEAAKGARKNAAKSGATKKNRRP
jgi:Flp pilus assembly protein TadD